MVPKAYPPQQKKTDITTDALRKLARSKAKAEGLASALPGMLAAALERSNHILLEDLLREAGYMLPQSENARLFLSTALERETHPAFPKAAAESLLHNTGWNEPASAPRPERWKCSVCGYVHERALPEGFVCPRCRQAAAAFVRLTD